MTAKNFFLYTFFQLVIFTLVKIIFFSYQLFFNTGFQYVVFWSVSAALAAAMARRIGVMNYLESVFIIAVWLLLSGFVDLLITSVYAGLDIFTQAEYWGGFLSMALTVLIFHKKRHVHVRKELQAKAHEHKH